jgi:hypothetical protein
VLILVTVGVISTASALLINDIKRGFAEAQLQGASVLLRDEVKGLLLPVRQQLLILRDGLRNRDLRPSDPQALNEHLMPPLAHIGQIAGAVFADGAGREYFLRRDGELWITLEREAPSETSADQLGSTRISEWLNDDDRLSTRQQPSTHDPRQRPWFQAAAQALDANRQDSAADSETGMASSRSVLDDSASVIWSQPYQFDSLDEPGITAATAWREDGELFVLALDVTLARILETIDGLKQNSAGTGFLFDRDGGVFGPLPNATERQPTASGFYSAEQRLGGATAFEAIAAWRAAGEPEHRPIRFESNGESWWAGFVPLDPAKSSAWVGVAYPSRGPLGLLQQRWPLFTGIALAILAFSIGLALVIVRRYSRRLRELPKLSIDPNQPETDLYDLIGRGESGHLEFKSTMRLNLRSGKHDKVIELAWLKGVAAFLNCEGGILLLGVADDGELLGLAADGFANDDKCLLHFKNLVNQHLGAEAMRHLQLRLFRLDDKQIGVIECEPADTPVYLRESNKGESFLIRTGPSNSELPISRALSYIGQRF